MENSLVKIINNKSSCTGWFFHPLKPYIISCGHIFQKNKVNDEFSIIFKGEKFKAKLLRYECEGVNDYSISIILDEIKEYLPIPISFSRNDFQSISGEKFLMYGYDSAAPEIGMHVGYLGNIIGTNHGKNNIRIFELIDSSRRDKKGVSGAPLLLQTKNGNQVIGLNISQNKSANEAFVCFALTNLFHLEEFKEVKQYNKDLKYIHPLHKKGNLANGYHRHTGICPVNTKSISSEKSVLLREIKKGWSEFIDNFYTELSRTHKEIPNHQNFFSKDIITYSFNNKGNFKNIDSFSVDNIRILIDIENKFNFFSPKEFVNKMIPIPNGSHLVGITLSDQDFIDSNNVFDQVIGIHNDGKRNIIECIYNVVKDILIDIFYFNSDPQNLPEKYPTQRNKKEFSLSKVKFAQKNNLLPYGLKLSLDLRFLSLTSLIRNDFGSKLDYNVYDLKWRELIEEFIPNHPEYSPNKGIINKPNKRFEILDNIEEIYKEFAQKIPVQYRGQLKRKLIFNRLGYYSINKSTFFFVFVYRRPRREKTRQSICQLFGKVKFHVHMHDVFSIEKIRLFERFKDYFLIIKYDTE